MSKYRDTYMYFCKSMQTVNTANVILYKSAKTCVHTLNYVDFSMHEIVYQTITSQISLKHNEKT